MISDGSCDTEDWSNDSALQSQEKNYILQYIQTPTVVKNGVTSPMPIL